MAALITSTRRAIRSGAGRLQRLGDLFDRNAATGSPLEKYEFRRGVRERMSALQQDILSLEATTEALALRLEEWSGENSSLATTPSARSAANHAMFELSDSLLRHQRAVSEWEERLTGLLEQYRAQSEDQIGEAARSLAAPYYTLPTTASGGMLRAESSAPTMGQDFASGSRTRHSPAGSLGMTHTHPAADLSAAFSAARSSRGGGRGVGRGGGGGAK